MTLSIVNRHGDKVAAPAGPLSDDAWLTPQIFERGDHIYMTAPVQVFTPKPQEIEELAFAQHLKQNAPNENILWLRGQYVEADAPNLNGAQWRAGELAIKSLTPMLMPITVMHDPRTAVGTIADVKLLTPEKDGVPRARLDTILAIWAHRFPEIADEAQANASAGTLMQSMECISPWYECSECGASFQKLPRGAERANWCAHLKASNPHAGYTDQAQTSNASRILGDVCFTGTGLIFGTRGARGAYTEAHLEVFQEEVAAHLSQVHNTSASTGRTDKMGLVQIEESELAAVRTERDTAKSDLNEKATALTEAERKIETLEAEKATAEEATKAEKKRADDLEAEKAKSGLKADRLSKLGSAFKAKIESLPSVKAKIEEQAGTMSEEDWTARLTEIEELAGVKPDAKLDGDTSTQENANNGDAPVFKPEEVASVALGGGGGGGGVKAPTEVERGSVVGKLADAFGGSTNGNKA